MAHLISDLERINSEVGENILQKFLAPQLFLDAPIMVIPYILQKYGKNYFLFREQESGNVDLIFFLYLKLADE